MHNGDDTSTVKLAELLKHPDDLHKIGALKSEFTRKKAAVDAQLKLGLAEQLQLTQAGLSTLHDGQSTVAAIKQEMMKIDRLGAEAQAMIKNFPEINAVAQAHRNFVAVETMQGNIDRFQYELGQVQELLKRDEQEIDRQPYLLNIHHAISRLRNIKEDAMEQISRADDPSLEDALNKAFEGLDDAVDEFDEHVGLICVNLLRLLEDGGDGLIVKLAIVIEEEEKFDTRTKELQEAQREFKGIAANFKTLAAGPRELRGYKDKMLGCIRQHFEDRLASTKERFQDNPDGLIKSLAWYFNELNAAKIGMVPLMPKKWKIFRVYTQIYHEGLRKWLEEVAKDPGIAPTHMLAIIHAKEKYLQKMNRLGARDEDLQPPIPGGHDSDLMREYRQLITTKLDEWMTELNKRDREAFLKGDMSPVETFEDVKREEERQPFRTKSLGDMWRIFREQLIVASAADLHQVTEGVCDAIFRAINTRREMWKNLIDEVVARCKTLHKPDDESPNEDSLAGIHGWLIALANDQIAIIDDERGSATGQMGFLKAFHEQMTPLVGPQYRVLVVERVNDLQDDITDLSIRCMAAFAQTILIVDLRDIMQELFTPTWHRHNFDPKKGMGAVFATLKDYLNLYRPGLQLVLHDCSITEAVKALMQAYLRAVHNDKAKFRTADNYAEFLVKDREMLENGFEAYNSYEDRDYVLTEVAQYLSVFDHILSLLNVQKDEEHLINAFDQTQRVYWDVKIGWVEALLRCRDDMEWSGFGVGRKTLNALRKHALKSPPKGPKGPNGEPPTLMELVD